MKWTKDPSRGFVPEPDEGDLAAEKFDFDAAEAKQFTLLQERMAENPRLQKQVVKRLRRMQRAQRMAPSIKTRRR